MTSTSPRPVPYPASPFTRRRARHPILLAAGIVQLVLTHLAGLGYALIGIGVGTCSGSSATGSCGRVLDRYDAAGWALALNAVVGVTAIVLTRRGLRPSLGRVVAATIAISTVVGIVAGVALWSTASG